MTKKRLTFEADYDFTLIGISCHSKDYRLCWEINKALFIDLVRTEDLEICKKNTAYFYPFYEYVDADNHIEYYFLSNKSDGSFLISEQKKVDFFLMIKGNTSTAHTNEIICKINTLSLVLTSFNLDVNGLKSKQNLLF